MSLKYCLIKEEIEIVNLKSKRGGSGLFFAGVSTPNCILFLKKKGDRNVVKKLY